MWCCWTQRCRLGGGPVGRHGIGEGYRRTLAPTPVTRIMPSCLGEVFAPEDLADTAVIEHGGQRLGDERGDGEHLDLG